MGQGHFITKRRAILVMLLIQGCFHLANFGVWEEILIWIAGTQPIAYVPRGTFIAVWDFNSSSHNEHIRFLQKRRG